MLTSQQINKIKIEISQDNRAFSDAFYALGDPGRFKIFRLFFKYRDVCVSDMAKILNISVPAASHQLKILEQSGLAVRERMGQMICYKINVENPLVRAIINVIQTGKVAD